MEYPHTSYWYMFIFIGLACVPTKSPASQNESVDTAQSTVTETVNLRPVFQVDRQTRYRVWTQIHHTMTDPSGGSTHVQYEIRGELTWLVQSVEDDGSATCVMEIDWLTSNQTKDNGATQRNDSRQPSGDSNLTHRRLVAMANTPVSFQVTPDGIVHSVNGTDAIRQFAGDSIDISEELDLHLIESATDLAMIAAAPDSAAAHDTWPVEFTWAHDLGRLQYNTTFTLASVEQIAGIRVAIAEANAPLQLNADTQKVRAALRLPKLMPDPEVQLASGSFRTQVMFDLSRHEAVGRNTIEHLNIQLVFSQFDQSATFNFKEHIHSQALRIDEQ